jgi:hypothetical protein
MSMIATSVPVTTASDMSTTAPSHPSPNDVVEIGLLLPTNWANTLIELSKQRHQSVAQILRGIIGSALHESVASV